MTFLSRLLVPIILVISTVSSVLAADPAPGAATIKPAATAIPVSTKDAKGKTYDPNKVVCQEEIPTGSRLGEHKVCFRQYEWDQQRRSGQEWLRHLHETNIGEH